MKYYKKGNQQPDEDTVHNQQQDPHEKSTIEKLAEKLGDFNKDSKQDNTELRDLLQSRLSEVVKAYKTASNNEKKQLISELKFIGNEVKNLGGNLQGEKGKFVNAYNKSVKEMEKSLSLQRSLMNRVVHGLSSESKSTVGNAFKDSLNPYAKVGVTGLANVAKMFVKPMPKGTDNSEEKLEKILESLNTRAYNRGDGNEKDSNVSENQILEEMNKFQNQYFSESSKILTAIRSSNDSIEATLKELHKGLDQFFRDIEESKKDSPSNPSDVLSEDVHMAVEYLDEQLTTLDKINTTLEAIRDSSTNNSTGNIKEAKQPDDTNIIQATEYLNEIWDALDKGLNPEVNQLTNYVNEVWSVLKEGNSKLDRIGDEINQLTNYVNEMWSSQKQPVVTESSPVGLSEPKLSALPSESIKTDGSEQILNKISDEINQLTNYVNEMWSSQKESNAVLAKADGGLSKESNSNEIVLLEKINDNVSAIKDQITAQTQSQQDNQRNSQEEQLKSLGKPHIKLKPQEKSPMAIPKSQAGFLDMGAILKALGVEVAIVGITKFAKGIGSFFTKTWDLVKGAGKIVGDLGHEGKLIPVIGEVITLISSIWDFFDGFSNADKILQKNKDKLNLRDRLAAGIGSVVGGLISIVDDITGVFGIKTDYGKKATEIIAKGLAGGDPAVSTQVPTHAENVKKQMTDMDNKKDTPQGNVQQNNVSNVHNAPTTIVSTPLISRNDDHSLRYNYPAYSY